MKKHNGKWIGLMVHHSAGSTKDTVESIRHIHKDINEWGDIGYHYVLEIKDGKGYLKKGRSTSYNGAHAGVDYYNNNYLGLCVPGNYSVNEMPTQIYNDLLSACCTIIKKFDLTKVKGHREVKATQCPGLKVDLKKLRQDINFKFKQAGVNKSIT